KPTANYAFNDSAAAFFAAHLKGSGSAPPRGSVTAFTTTCPNAAAGPPDGGPYTASSWDAIHPGAVVFGSAGAQTVLSSGGNPQTAATFDPILNSNACKTVPTENVPGTATYSAPSLGFTLLGLPTIAATISTSGANGQLDARLWDVSPGGTQLLVTHGVFRLLDNQAGTIRFQLHGNGYRFAPGHTVKLELLGSDPPYYRASNGSFSVSVQNLAVALPVAERPAATSQIVPPPNLNTLSPAPFAQRVALRAHRLASDGGASRFFTVWISPSGRRAGAVARYEAQVRPAGARRWRGLGRRGSRPDRRGRASLRFGGAYGQTYWFRARAISAAGRPGPWAYASVVMPFDDRYRASPARYGAGWRRLRMRGASLGLLSRASRRGARVTMLFRGSRYYVVARRGPFGGRALVLVDGRRRGTIDLYAPRARERQVVASRAVNPRRLHRLTIVVLGSRDRRSRGTLVELDAFAFRRL
ncbi:MAG: CocE/NonD family hydrolase C-terminal non-catalytic domain-containing protein, partial [Solirubrobacteraceae bacterium]